ncbi:MAG: hypothetical protein FJY20_11470 [Bacteroidetes bacterium]|nr:hypothetical protein [Bacteroidota bacterium]
MHELGIVTFFGFIGAGIITLIRLISFLGDNRNTYERQFKIISAACFAVAGLIALIQLLRVTGYTSFHIYTSFGLYLAILAGVVGAAFVYILKPEQLEKK